MSCLFKGVKDRRTGTTFGTKITEHDDGFFTFLDGARFDGFNEIIFSVKCTGAASKTKAFLARDLCHGTARSEIAFQDPVRSEI